MHALKKTQLGWGDITHLYHICFIWGFFIRESRNLYLPLVKSKCFLLCVSFVWPEIKQVFSSESLATYVTCQMSVHELLYVARKKRIFSSKSLATFITRKLSVWVFLLFYIYVSRTRRSLATYVTRKLNLWGFSPPRVSQPISPASRAPDQ